MAVAATWYDRQGFHLYSFDYEKDAIDFARLRAMNNEGGPVQICEWGLYQGIGKVLYHVGLGEVTVKKVEGRV